MRKYLRLIRPKQWTKNLFVFLPLFFGGKLLYANAITDGIIVFLAFSFAASSIYCFNDIQDVEDDRKHSVKCHRPIASGEISIKSAYMLMFLLIGISCGLLFLIPSASLSTMGVILFYWLLNIGYCLKLKQYAIIDVSTVALGFVLRILAGGLATDIILSNWIVLMTFLITLFMSFAKRRDDVIRMNETGIAPRKNTIRYNITFINQAITITTSVTLVCYIMYTLSPDVQERFHSDYLYLTTIFVIIGLLRYIQITVVDQKSGDPTKILLTDRFVQLIIVAWFMSFLFLIY